MYNFKICISFGQGLQSFPRWKNPFHYPRTNEQTQVDLTELEFLAAPTDLVTLVGLVIRVDW